MRSLSMLLECNVALAFDASGLMQVAVDNVGQVDNVGTMGELTGGTDMLDADDIEASGGGRCCWSKWGAASDCGKWKGPGGRCGNDNGIKCYNDNPCTSGIPRPRPQPRPRPRPNPQPDPPPATGSGCGCTAPKTCFVPGWKVPCMEATEDECSKYNGNWCGASQSPPPSPPRQAPVPRPQAPRPQPAPPSSSGTFKGFWRKTWTSEVIPSATEHSIAFNGYADAGQALDASDKVRNQLKGNRWISMGGGNHNGHTTIARLQGWINKIEAGKFKNYYGIALDPEEGDSNLCSKLTETIRVAKKKGLKTMVTIPHQQPYGIRDAPALMRCIFDDTNLDYLSPQLYTSGTEQHVDYALSGHAADQIKWSDYGRCKAKLIPSISYAFQYDEVKKFFASKQGGEKQTDGYVLWSTGGASTGGGNGGGGSSANAGTGSNCADCASQGFHCYNGNWAMQCYAPKKDDAGCLSTKGEICYPQR